MNESRRAKCFWQFLDVRQDLVSAPHDSKNSIDLDKKGPA